MVIEKASSDFFRKRTEHHHPKGSRSLCFCGVVLLLPSVFLWSGAGFSWCRFSLLLSGRAVPSSPQHFLLSNKMTTLAKKATFHRKQHVSA